MYNAAERTFGPLGKSIVGLVCIYRHPVLPDILVSFIATRPWAAINNRKNSHKLYFYFALAVFHVVVKRFCNSFNPVRRRYVLCLERIILKLSTTGNYQAWIKCLNAERTTTMSSNYEATVNYKDTFSLLYITTKQRSLAIFWLELI